MEKFKLGGTYPGNDKVDGDSYLVEPLGDGPKPFRLININISLFWVKKN